MERGFLRILWKYIEGLGLDKNEFWREYIRIVKEREFKNGWVIKGLYLGWSLGTSGTIGINCFWGYKWNFCVVV